MRGTLCSPHNIPLADGLSEALGDPAQQCPPMLSMPHGASLPLLSPPHTCCIGIKCSPANAVYPNIMCHPPEAAYLWQVEQSMRRTKGKWCFHEGTPNMITRKAASAPQTVRNQEEVWHIGPQSMDVHLMQSGQGMAHIPKAKLLPTSSAC